ncbi:MAG: hypothetical protein JWR06_2411 [Jatrophihabitans sp.]|nr:hypothetical protein [Jatrophihabitans sp.]MCW2658218.1 hypothetical protein [Jatrophihabitans sp.]MDT4905028.1 hypothetical protein [Pseudonocardiales bacterium]MDT4928030.1 hypothetical protein [Pseudonocardiales bacterium]
MKVLILWADPRGTNLGVRALAAGTAALVRRVWPDAEIVYQGYGPGDAPMRIGVKRNLGREYVKRHSVLKDWIRTLDLVVDTRAGDSFSDSYGLHRHYGMSTMYELVSRLGIPIVLGPQTIGPFVTRRGRFLAKSTLRRAAVVMARDPMSAECASDLGRPVDLLTTDVVFALDPPSVEQTRDVIVNVSGLLWNENPHVDSGAYRTTVLELGRALMAGGRRLTLLAHVLDSYLADNDVPAIQDVAAHLGDQVEVVIPTSLEHARDVLASGTVVVGSRMHACLNALSGGVPAVPLAYSRKFAPLLAQLGWTYGVDLRTAADPVGDVLAALASPGLDDQVHEVRARADKSLALATELLRAAGPRQ